MDERRRRPAELYRTAAVHSRLSVQQDSLGLNEQLVLAASGTISGQQLVLSAYGTISGQVAEDCKAEDQILSVDNEIVSRTVSPTISKAGRFGETLEASKYACACGSCVHASYIPADLRSNKYVLVVYLQETNVFATVAASKNSKDEEGCLEAGGQGLHPTTYVEHSCLH